MSANQQSQEHPWLNDDFLKKIIKNDLNTNEEISIAKFSSNAAVPIGENYSSQMRRVSVTFSIGNGTVELEKTYIVKCMLNSDTVIGQVMKDLNMFGKEVIMYSETLPAIMDLVNSESDSRVQIMPRLLYWTNEPHDVMVLEDLTPQGFKVSSRRDGLDREHCEMALTRLACMHAASMVLNRKNPKFRDNFNQGGFFEDMPDMVSGFYTNGVKNAISVMKKIPECKKYVKFYEVYEEFMIKQAIELLHKIPEDEDNFNVLNHGDFWVANMLFKDDSEGKPVDVRFVDFQLPMFGNPGIDLNYFFFVSADDKTRDQHRESTLKKYHQTLASSLVKWDYKGFIPTYKDLMEKLHEAKVIAIMTPCTVLPIVKLDKESSKTISIDKIMDSNESGSHLYSNQLYYEALKKALACLEKVGFIEAE